MEVASPPPRVPTVRYRSDLEVNSNFPVLTNTNFIRAARGEQVDRIPIWIMRQAGRYLEEFRKLREQHDFFEMCTTPELACEVTLQPIRRFDFDASIIFSDILVVPQAMGLTVVMLPGKGPTFPEPLDTPEDLSRCSIPDYNTAFEAYYDAIYLTRHSLQGKVPLLGFSGGPFTLMAYMIEGGGSKTFLKTKNWLYNYPEESKRLLSMITDILCEFLLGQICSGAQALQVFESHAGSLSPADFDEFLLPYINRIAQFLKEKAAQNPQLDVPLTIFAKGAHYALERLADSPYDVIGLDWTFDIQKAKSVAFAKNKTLQGNLDPALLFAPASLLQSRIEQMKSEFGNSRYICNLGHGIEPTTDPRSVQLFIETIHN
jgi:uroporphyrinogen decarboxylase